MDKDLIKHIMIHYFNLDCSIATVLGCLLLVGFMEVLLVDFVLTYGNKAFSIEDNTLGLHFASAIKNFKGEI